MEKSCANHSDAPAIAACKVCDKALCSICAAEVHGRVFCSPDCVSVYKEVTHWIDRKAEPHEWNPLASTPLDTGAEPSTPPPSSEPSVSSLPKDETVLDATRGRPAPPPTEPKADETLTPPPDPTSEDPSLIIRRREAPAPESPCAQHPELPAIGTCAQCGKAFCGSCAIEMTWGKFCSVECSIARPPEAFAPARRKVSPALWAAAAVALIAAGVVFLRPAFQRESKKEEPRVAKAAPKSEPLNATPVTKTEPPKPPAPVEPPKVVIAKSADPKTEAPKVDPPKSPDPVVPKASPPTPPPAKVETVPAKVEPVKPPPVKVDPAPSAEPKVEPPAKHPESPRPKPPPAVETPKVEPPKPPPPAPVEPPPPPPRVKAGPSLEEAAKLIRDVAPLFKEIADGLDENVSDRSAARALLNKVERVRKNLRDARQIYLDLGAASPDPAQIDGRIRRIDSLLETMAGCLEQIKSRL